jgi:hypothetical protein
MFMSINNSAKNRKIATLHLGGELPITIVDIFRRQCEQRHQQKFGALAAAVKIWTELPTDIQSRLLDESTENPVFVDIVNEIVDKRLSLKSQEKSPRNSLHEAILHIKEMVEIERQQPGTIYRVLDSDEQKVLDDFRKMMLKENKKTRSA